MGKAIETAQKIAAESIAAENVLRETLKKAKEETEAKQAAVPAEEVQTELPAITLDELENISAEAFSTLEEPKGPFRIADDSAADWAVQKIAEERRELARITKLADDQIARIMEKVEAAERRCENGTSFLTAKLAEYFETVPHKTTKTQHTYRLLSGTLKKKIGGTQLKPDNEKLLEFLKASGNTDMIRTKEEPAWGDYKKRLEITGGQVIDTETGEIVEGVNIEEKLDTFVVEV